jgi:hypothetical protein
MFVGAWLHYFFTVGLSEVWEYIRDPHNNAMVERFQAEGYIFY